MVRGFGMGQGSEAVGVVRHFGRKITVYGIIRKYDKLFLSKLSRTDSLASSDKSLF